MRRFTFSDEKFIELEKVIRTIYSVPTDVLIKVQFMDDENDWVVISSDCELQHALQLVSGLLRLTITDASPTLAPVNVSEQPDVCQHPRRNWQEENAMTRQERLNLKSNRLSLRIQQIEAQLKSDEISSPRARALHFKLLRIQEKLAYTKSRQENPDLPENHVPHHGRGRCGRGRGRCGGRGRGRGGNECGSLLWGRGSIRDSQITEETPFTGNSDPNVADDWDLKFRVKDCKLRLKLARDSGKTEEIEKCRKEWMEAKRLRREARSGQKDSEVCGAHTAKDLHKSHLRDLKMKIKTARHSGNTEEVQKLYEQVQTSKQNWHLNKNTELRTKVHK